ncbi:Adenylate kinase isoenzyme 1 [Vulpes lagopus]
MLCVTITQEEILEELVGGRAHSGQPWSSRDLLRPVREGRAMVQVGRAPDIVMVFDCSMDTMVRRVLHRGRVEHRADDCESAIRQRLETYYMLCEPVLTFYQQKNLLCNILAEEAPENIFAKCCSVVESLQ